MKTFIKCNRYYFEDWKMYSAMWLVYSTTVEAGTIVHIFRLTNFLYICHCVIHNLKTLVISVWYL